MAPRDGINKMKITRRQLKRLIIESIPWDIIKREEERRRQEKDSRRPLRIPAPEPQRDPIKRKDDDRKNPPRGYEIIDDYIDDYINEIIDEELDDSDLFK